MAPKRPRQPQGSEQPEGIEAAKQGAAGRTRAKTKGPVGRTEAAEPRDKPSRSKAASKQQAQNPAPEADSKPAAKKAKKGDEPELVATVLDLSEGKRDKSGGCLKCRQCVCQPGFPTASYTSLAKLVRCLSPVLIRPVRGNGPTKL